MNKNINCEVVFSNEFSTSINWISIEKFNYRHPFVKFLYLVFRERYSFQNKSTKLTKYTEILHS